MKEVGAKATTRASPGGLGSEPDGGTGFHQSGVGGQELDCRPVVFPSSPRALRTRAEMETNAAM